MRGQRAEGAESRGSGGSGGQSRRRGRGGGASVGAKTAIASRSNPTNQIPAKTRQRLSAGTVYI
jgi:hypothetical protein